MGSRKRDCSWPPADAVIPPAVPATDNHTYLPITTDASGPDSEMPLSAVELVGRATVVGVTYVVASAYKVTTQQENLALTRQLPGVYVALAVHPNEAVPHIGVRKTDPDGLTPRAQEHYAEPLEEVMIRLEETLRANVGAVVTIGESGLDFFRTGEKEAIVQRKAFRACITLARDLDLPLRIHGRDAHAACVEVLEADGASARTVFHCFSGEPQLAVVCAEHGWYASIADLLTYLADDILQEVVAALLGSLLLAETDAPHLPSKRWHGRPNASYLLGDTICFLAEQRGLSERDLYRRLQATTETVYGAWRVLSAVEGRRAPPETRTHGP